MIIIGELKETSKKIEIDLTNVNNRYSFFKTIGKVLNFPSVLVGNWDSFLDFMSFIYLDISSYNSVCFILKNSATFMNCSDFSMAKKCLEIIASNGLEDEDLKHIDCSFMLEM